MLILSVLISSVHLSLKMHMHKYIRSYQLHKHSTRVVVFLIWSHVFYNYQWVNDNYKILSELDVSGGWKEICCSHHITLWFTMFYARSAFYTAASENSLMLAQ